MGQYKSVRRGFPNIGDIRKSIGLLVPKIKIGALPAPNVAWQGWRKYKSADPIVSAQYMAIAVAKAYELEVGTLIVAFRSSLKHAAEVEIGPSNDFFIEIDNRFKGRPKDLGAILGHELAHIFLHKQNIKIDDVWANEILTDTTAAVYGFGALMADSYRVSVSTRNVAAGIETTTREEALGYLTPDELGYVLTRCSPDNIASYLASSAAKGAFRQGRRLALRDMRTPPQLLAPLSDKLLYKLHRFGGRKDKLRTKHRYAFVDAKVSFRCPVCCQAMRLPIKKKLQAKCPRCEFEFDCRT